MSQSTTWCSPLDAVYARIPYHRIGSDYAPRSAAAFAAKPAGQAIEAMLKGAVSLTSGRWSAAIGIVRLLVAAHGVVVPLKHALDTVFEAKEPENAGPCLVWRVCGISSAGTLALDFLLAVSLIISTALAGFSSWISGSASPVTPSR